MKTQLLIATPEHDYAEHLSNTLAEKHSDAICAVVCSDAENLRELLQARKFDIALFDESMVDSANLNSVKLPLVLWNENEAAYGISCDIKRIRKYQRISVMVSALLELYSKAQTAERGMSMNRARITAVWSPMGGAGKTTVALAYSAGKVSEGRQVLYLDMEPFSSVDVYFTGKGRGLSAVFEMLESGEGNVEILARSLRKQDGHNDIAYLCSPENFDDMNILSPENTAVLIDACAGVADELVIDMSGICDDRARKIFDLADKILLVIDPSHTSQIKLFQFLSQNSVFQRIKNKTTLVANKGAVVKEQYVDTIVCLPMIQSTDSVMVYKTLSGYRFDA